MSTTGFSRDTDGYIARVSPSLEVPLTAEDSAVVDDMEPATYDIELDGVEPNCATTPPGPYRVTVEPGAAAILRLEIACRGVLRDVVLFTTLDGTGPAGMRVMEMRSDGSEVSPRYVGAYARLSPNGEEVVYVSYTEFGLRRVRVDGVGGVVVLSTALHQGPDWSPDGALIAFTGDQSGQWQLYTMDRDGSPVQRLSTSDRQEALPHWSPDGSRIAISRTAATGDSEEIVIVQADGGGESVIATGTGGVLAWSPDGTKFLYSDITEGNRIGVMNVDGSEPHVITDGPDFSAVWSPDGTEIMFSRAGVGIFRADASGTNPTLVLPLTSPAVAQVVDVWR